MEAHTCNHPLVAHTVSYSLGSKHVVRAFNDLEDADAFAQKVLRQDTARLKSLKIYRSDNESYICFQWEKDGATQSDETVKLEVDMNPLKEAFDNVATGFGEQGKAIRSLQILSVVVLFLVVLNFLLDWII